MSKSYLTQNKKKKENTCVLKENDLQINVVLDVLMNFLFIK